MNLNVFLEAEKFKVSGNVNLSSDHPIVNFQDIEVGNVPEFILGPLRTAVEDASSTYRTRSQ